MRNVDSLLDTLILGLGDTGPIDLVIKIGDLWVLGKAVHLRSWIDAVEAKMSSKNAALTVSLLRKVASWPVDDGSRITEDGLVYSVVDEDDPVFLHLADCKVLTPQSVSPPLHGLFRCRTDEISAWALVSENQGPFTTNHPA